MTEFKHHWNIMTFHREKWWKPWANTLVYYNINDNDTSTTIYDLSWNNNNLSWTTITYWTDATVWKVFTAWRPSSSIINFGNEFTFISWAYYTAATGCIFSNGAWASSFASNSLFAWYNTNKMTGFVWGNTTNPAKWIISQSDIPTNQWVMYAYTRDSSWNLKIYLNATLDNTTTIATNPVYPSWTTFMFWWWWGWGNDMNGKIKTLIWENRTWTADEIAKYYNQTKSKYWIS